LVIFQDVERGVPFDGTLKELIKFKKKNLNKRVATGTSMGKSFSLMRRKIILPGLPEKIFQPENMVYSES